MLKIELGQNPFAPTPPPTTTTTTVDGSGYLFYILHNIFIYNAKPVTLILSPHPFKAHATPTNILINF